VALDDEAQGPSRVDDVTIRWEGLAPGEVPRPLGQARLHHTGLGTPAWSVALAPRAGRDGEVRLEVFVHGDGRVAREARVSLAFPERDDVELIEVDSGRIVVGDTPQRASLGLRWRGAGPRPELPLVLRVRSGGAVTELPFTLPAAGQRLRPLSLAPPSLETFCTLAGEAVSCDAGLDTSEEFLALRVRAREDGQLRSLGVEGARERVRRRNGARSVELPWERYAWAPLSGSEGDVEVRIPLAPGSNRVRVVAEDAQGLRREQSFVVTRRASLSAPGR
jgi:hypothetical protein